MGKEAGEEEWAGAAITPQPSMLRLIVIPTSSLMLQVTFKLMVGAGCCRGGSGFLS